MAGDAKILVFLRRSRPISLCGFFNAFKVWAWIGRWLDFVALLGSHSQRFALFLPGFWRGHHLTKLIQSEVDWPGVVDAGAVDSDAVINAVDLFAKFADIGGATMPPEYRSDGQNLSGLFRGGEFSREAPLYWQRVGPKDEEGRRQNVWAAVRDGRWKLHQWNDGTVELYDLSVDRAEETDVSAEYPMWSTSSLP